MAESNVSRVAAGAWNTWKTRIKWNMEVKDMESYLQQAIERGGSLEEACRTIFAEGFTAGARFGRASVFRECERRHKIN